MLKITWEVELKRHICLVYRDGAVKHFGICTNLCYEPIYMIFLVMKGLPEPSTRTFMLACIEYHKYTKYTMFKRFI